MKANYNEDQIIVLLHKIRIFNRKIGVYQLHAINENFNYVVKLSNGKIYFAIEDLQDDEKDALSQERLKAIANRFVSSEKGESKNQNSKSKPQIPGDSSKKKGSLRKAILIGIIVLMSSIGIFNFIEKSFINGDTYNTGDSYTEKVMTVEQIEKSDPTRFLSADGTYRENFWGNKFNIECKIANNATVVTYKDALVRVTYFTKTKTVIGSKEYTIYEIFPPSSSKTIDLKIDNYENVNSIGWEVISAKIN